MSGPDEDVDAVRREVRERRFQDRLERARRLRDEPPEATLRTACELSDLTRKLSQVSA